MLVKLRKMDGKTKSQSTRHNVINEVRGSGGAGKVLEALGYL